jgi:t-SNARE complex subunit (syntaxin)
MDEDRVARLLEEIRDLQRQQLDAYARALGNQEQALRLQQAGLGRARRLLAGVGLIIIIVLVIVVVLLRYALQHYT